MKQSRMGLAIVVCVQVAFLSLWAGYHEWLLHAAPVVRLKVVPVDPRDILRGQYFTLGYEIGRVDQARTDDFRPGEGDTVWVGLDRDGEFWHARGLYQDARVARSAHAFAVRGTVGRPWPGGPIQVRFGIEHYYVPEGTPTPDASRLVVEATVSPEGLLNIKRVLLDGRPFP